MFAIWIGLYRQLVMPVLVFWFLAHLLGMGLQGIWWGIAAINWSAALISVWFTLKKLKTIESISQA
jgi:Na+-driven multidrug efflux pump